jgi:hypothetical protein
MIAKEGDYHTGLQLFNWNIIVQRLRSPREVCISISKDGADIPSEEEVGNIVSYLGEEGFLDYSAEETVKPNTKLQVGYLPKYKFKALETIIQKKIHHG